MVHERITVRAGSPADLLRLLGWRGTAALAAAAALVLALALVVGAVFLIVLPVALGAGLLTRWLAGRRAGPPAEPPPELRIETWSREVEIRPEQVEILPPRRRR